MFHSTSARPAVDVGGGRGDLALSIAKAFPEMQVLSIDLNSQSLAAAQERATELGLGNIRFIRANFRDLDLTTEAEALDLAVALHACGGLSDAVIDFCLRHRLSFLVAPCCFLKHVDLVPRSAWPQYCPPVNASPPVGVSGINGLGYSSGEAADDAGAGACLGPTVMGPNANSTEGSVDPSKSAHLEVLRRLAESDRRDISVRAMQAINSLRLHACRESLQKAEPAAPTPGQVQQQGAWSFALNSFPAAFSLRNQVLEVIQAESTGGGP